MSTATIPLPPQQASLEDSVQQHIMSMVEEMIDHLPDPKRLTAEQRRGIIARYASVLEGNFIYWMTATSLAVQAEEARPILTDNLHEEVRDSHPVMLRRFAIAAHAFPTDADALSVDADLTKMRLFLGKLQGVQSLAAMAFFEAFIQRFMGYLAELAAAQGSTDMVYTDVHGVCDIAHSQGLFRAVAIENSRYPLRSGADLYEGVTLLQTLIQRIIEGPAPDAGAARA